MAQILFGFGGVQFDSNINGNRRTATFAGGSGNITYTPIQIIKENMSYNILSRLKGYRVTIDITELINIDSDDYIQYQYLAQILSDLVDSDAQQYVTVTPRDDTTLTNSIEYNCILTGAFSPEDVHRVKTGQRLALSFTCINKHDTIPTVVSDTSNNTYVDDDGGTNDYWDGTDQYIDELG